MINTTSNQNTERMALASVSAPDPGMDSRECLAPQRSEPCIIVIMGATGDLTARKLIPALFNLYLNGGLPESFQIVGCGRTKLESTEFRKRMETALEAAGMFDQAQWQAFTAALHYQIIDYDNLESYTALAEFIKDLDRQRNTRGNRIFYIALPPILYKTVAQMIGRAGLSAEMSDGNGWSRIVVEKPFGTNLETAVDLDRSLHQYFTERQIFRIDHYLAKETVQNVLMFRFANALFEPIWNRRYVDHIVITATETLGVEHRAGYYEHSGVLRDMFQNHMMQLLALTAMEPPSRFEDGTLFNVSARSRGSDFSQSVNLGNLSGRKDYAFIPNQESRCPGLPANRYHGFSLRSKLHRTGAGCL